MTGVASGFDPTRKPKKRERSVENYLKERIESIGGKCYKFVSPGTDGMPDRIVIYKGTVVFIETKRPGGKPRALQKERIEELRALGVSAFSINALDQVEQLILRLTLNRDSYD